MTIIGPDISLIYSLLTAKCIDLSLLIDYSTYFRDVIQFGEQRWRSGESTRLPLIWPGFNSRRRRHMWVKVVVVSFPCSERFFSVYSGFPLSSKTNISKFQFDQESGRRRTTMRMWYLQIVIYLFIYLFIYFILLLSFLSGVRLIEVFNNRN